MAPGSLSGHHTEAEVDGTVEGKPCRDVVTGAEKTFAQVGVIVPEVFVESLDTMSNSRGQ